MNLRNKLVAVSATIGAAMATTANAALPTGIDTSLAAVQTDALAMADLVWPVVIALFGSVVLFKLFKRYASKI